MVFSQANVFHALNQNFVMKYEPSDQFYNIKLSLFAKHMKRLINAVRLLKEYFENRFELSV